MPRAAGNKSGSRAKARSRAAPRLARTCASSVTCPVAPLHSRAVTLSKLALPARLPTKSPAMINSPRSPSTWLSTVSAAGTPSRPIWLLVRWMFMAGSLLVHGGKVGPLDRLINLDYINQYEKIRGALPLRPRGLRRAIDLAGHALRLCQPRPDPLRAVAGYAQPPLPGRGRSGAEGAPGAGAGAARPAQLRCRSPGDGFRDRHHHRSRRDLSRR